MINRRDLRANPSFTRKSPRRRAVSQMMAFALSASMILGSLTMPGLDVEAAELELGGGPTVSGDEILTDAAQQTPEPEAKSAEELAAEELAAMMAAADASASVLFSGQAGGSYADFTEDEVVADFSFGMNEQQMALLESGTDEQAEQLLEAVAGAITSGNYYKNSRGYGFRDVEYNNEARGWEGSVYYPRTISRQEAGTSYVQDGVGYLGISSKVWREVNTKEYRDYTYENTSSFDMAVDNADYLVAVTLVNPTSEAYKASLKAEDLLRYDLAEFAEMNKDSIEEEVDRKFNYDFQVEPGASRVVTFHISVLDGELNLKFLSGSGSAADADNPDTAEYKTVYVSHLTVTRRATEAEGDKPTIFLASDSTVQSYAAAYDPQTGWGEVLYQFFGTPAENNDRPCNDCDYYQAQIYETDNVVIQNRAMGGRSSRSFVEEGKLNDLLEDIRPGDYLFVQWGHNDATASRPNRYTAASDFANWILRYIEGAQQRGATPVLVTPCARNSYSTNADGSVSFKSDFEAYRQVMLSLSAERGIPLIDLTARSIAYCNSLGVEGVKDKVFLFADPGEYQGNYANGVQDNTHLQESGAISYAQFVAQGILENPSDQLSGLRDMITVEAKPSTPQNVHCVSPALGATEAVSEIKLAWDQMGGVTRFDVYRSDTRNGEYVKVGESAANEFTDSSEGLETSRRYYYKVKAVNASGESDFSAVCETPVCGVFITGGHEQYSDRAAVAIDLAGRSGAQTYVTATDKDGNEYTKGVYLSWRSYGADLDENHDLTTSFTVYKNGSVLAEGLNVTNLIDESGSAADTYKVVGSNDEALGLASRDIKPWADKYLELNLFAPADQTMPNGNTCEYYANDMSVGDLDGDGVLELIVKWYPSNAKDSASGGYTGTTFLDAYKVDYATGGVQLMWRIDVGINVRSGAHYTQFQVWDFDGDGKAEIALKTADGTTSFKSTDGTDATLVEQDHVGEASSTELTVSELHDKHDYRNGDGRILEGPEYFSIFNGEDGSLVDTADYLPAYGSVGSWGDDWGNRGDRYLSATAYLNGETPFAVFCKGYYARTTLTAYYLTDTDGDGVGDKIAVYWTFDTSGMSNGSSFTGQGNHGLSVNDVDGDGFDEIIYGSLTVDNDGTPLYTTGLGHGDAMHVSDWVSWNDGLEIMGVHEDGNARYHVEIHDAATGEILMGYRVKGYDVGRGAAADIDPTAEGAEFWSIAGVDCGKKPEWNYLNGDVYSTWSTLGNENLKTLSKGSTPASNAPMFWDGDLLSEVQDHTFDEGPYLPIGVALYKWNYEKNEQELLFYSEEIYSNNGTKGNVGLLADVLGDWREEIIARTSADKNKVRIYTTTIQTDYVVPCLLEDQAYREGVAWQNVAYNQPANTAYLISQGLVTAQLSEGDLSLFTDDTVAFDFTEANDSDLYGHPVVGYEIYRSEDGGEYALLDSIGESVDDAEGNRTSHMSRPITLQTSGAIAEAPVIGKQTLVEATPLAKGQTVADLLPKTVTVTGADGVQYQAAVTWDADSVNLEEPDSYTVYATVKGWPEVIEVEVEVVRNSFKEFKSLEARTMQGAMPVLPKTVTAVYENNTTRVLNVTWDTANLDVSQLGDVTVYGSVYGIEEKAEVLVHVVANYITSIEELYLEIPINSQDVNALLPGTVNAKWADGATTQIPVTWDVSAVKADTKGAYEVSGTLGGETDSEIKPVAHVSVAYPAIYKFDFGISSGNVADGWIGITVNEKGGKQTVSEKGIGYSELTHYGFKDPAGVFEGRAESYTQAGLLPSKVYTDFALPAGQTFLVDVDRGIYEVEMVTGSIYSTTSKAEIEGTSLSVGCAEKAYSIGSVQVEVTDGQLTIDFTAGNTSRVDALIVRKVSDTVADKEVLRNLIAVAGELDSELYTAESYAGVDSALKAAQNMVSKVGATQAEVDDAAQALKDAIAALETVTPAGAADKSALNAAIARAEGLKAEDYTAESYAVVVDALKDAKAVAAQADATKTQVDLAEAVLTRALDSLVGENLEADKSELLNLITEIQNLDGSAYTIASYIQMMKVFKEANTVAGTPGVTQSEVNDAVKKLSAAKDALVQEIPVEQMKRFDFGIKSGEVADGWIGITVNAKKGKKKVAELGIDYTAERGYGFADGQAIFEGRSESFSQDGNLPERVYRDHALPAGQTFLVDVENGTYEVEFIGASANSGSGDVTVEGTVLKTANSGGEYTSQSVVVEVTDGQLTMEFQGGGVTIRIAAILVKPVTKTQAAAAFAAQNGMFFAAPAMAVADEAQTPAYEADGMQTADNADGTWTPVEDADDAQAPADDAEAALVQSYALAREESGTGNSYSYADGVYTYKDTGLTAGVSYSYKVAAILSTKPEEEVDKTALQKAVEDAEALTEEKYTAESFAAMREALEAGRTVYGDDTATQVQVDAAAEALNAAIATLVLVTPVDPTPTPGPTQTPEPTIKPTTEPTVEPTIKPTTAPAPTPAAEDDDDDNDSNESQGEQKAASAKTGDYMGNAATASVIVLAVVVIGMAAMVRRRKESE